LAHHFIGLLSLTLFSDDMTRQRTSWLLSVRRGSGSIETTEYSSRREAALAADAFLDELDLSGDDAQARRYFRAELHGATRGTTCCAERFRGRALVGIHRADVSAKECLSLPFLVERYQQRLDAASKPAQERELTGAAPLPVAA
jgi:hypothetical protein